MPEYNDGSVPYGFGATATVDTSPTSGALVGVYVLESLAFDVGGFQIERRSGSNVMSGRVAGDDSAGVGEATPQNLTGTATLQRATSSTVAPKIGNGISFSGANMATPISSDSRMFVVTGVTHNYGQAEAHTFSVNFAATSIEL